MRSTIAQLSVSSTIYQSNQKSGRAARNETLTALLADLTQLKVAQLSIEQARPHDNRADRQLIAQTHPSFSYAHYPKTDPMLWMPDTIAWCYGKGGQWKADLTRLKIPVKASNPKKR